MRNLRRRMIAVSILALVSIVVACGGGGGGGGSSGTPPASRSFYMGSTPYFARPGLSPDFRFENMDERDLLSLHVDDFWGVPWDYCNASGCANLPSSWQSQWQALAGQARATGKPIYLAVSPLGDRRTLAKRVNSDGTLQEHWLPGAAVDANGCYRFSSDANAATYQAAYIGFMKYLIDLVGPDFVSPAIEMNMEFTTCPAEKDAWIAWYAGVHAAIKAAHPALPVFATFQMESMYGITDAASACGGSLTLEQCFDSRLIEALTIAGDRFALSTYPMSWRLIHSGYPTDTYAVVKQATARPIWVSETGWPAVKVLVSYPHGTAGTCGAVAVSASDANDDQQAAYLAWLLGEAQHQGVETVIWWLNRDYLDGAVSAGCPCAPAASDTCSLLDQYYQAGEQALPGSGGTTLEFILRVFGNMALHNYDGSRRPAGETWHSWLARPRG